MMWVNSWLLFVIIGALSSCGPMTNYRPSRVEEAWDAENAPKLFNIESLRLEELASAESTRGLLSVKPWTDDYWPYFRKGMALRYLTHRDFRSFRGQIANARRAGDKTYLLSPAEKYDLINNDDSFALTRDSWKIYRDGFAEYGDAWDKWDWMGICDGWAPAAYREPAPQRHVLATNSAGKSVLFFAGDIRGLLSKAYATNALDGEADVIGSRCDRKEKDIVRDGRGRPLDGAFSGQKGFFVIEDQWERLGVLKIRMNTRKKEILWLANQAGPTASSAASGTFAVYVYDNQRALGQDINDNDLGARATGARTRTITLTRSCRDVNPGSFHLALARLIADPTAKDKGFVIELDRAEQVWNYPVWGFRAKIGTPFDIDDDDSGLRPFRAPGTRQIVPVVTSVIYVEEPATDVERPATEARFDYPGEFDVEIDWQRLVKDDERYAVEELKYTLEIDANGYVIGGEWRETRDEMAAGIDFIWRVRGRPSDTNAATGEDSVISYSLVKQLLDCSRRGRDGSSIEVVIGGQEHTITPALCDIR